MYVLVCASLSQVGARFTSATLALMYGQNVPYLNPTFVSACQQRVGSNLVITVNFDPATMYVHHNSTVPFTILLLLMGLTSAQGVPKHKTML